ncbi:uncharacterized protein BX663DRAFT_430986 [Cokeromyces recurvatus]|uniref:uncharacterized protein n=1 Tax=Cokeromyces recurvatus TaxID=90255 RepID=UPI00221E6DE9|nr:uncharacterized protein BX663DRAFT_430986 [Cokeromyces recurvatus]KAI7904493.1 hypothetical protein BX663DRAFT_430986 [Cokeromyces recurvatus]
MNVITREQAICMFFCEEYNEDNVKKLTKEVDDFVNGEICYTEDPTKPFIQSKRTINQNPFLYHKYQTQESVANINIIEEKEQQLINNHAGLVQFLNAVFLSVDPHNNEVYENLSCSMNDILSYVWKYSYLLQDKNPIGFGKWCSGKDIDLMHGTTKRKKGVDGRTILVRSLYVLKEKYIGKVHKLLFYLHSFNHTIYNSKCCKVYCRTITIIPADHSVFQGGWI